MRYWPIFFDSAGKRAVVVGGGCSAAAKARLLAKSEFTIEIVAPELGEECRALIEAGRAHWRPKRFEGPDGVGAALIYVCPDDEAEEAELAASARASDALITVADRPDLADFITPALVDRDPVVVAIGTEGTAPVLARSIKADLEARLDQGLGALARLAASLRDEVASKIAPGAPRRAFWQRFFRAKSPGEAAASLEPPSKDARGSIALVGAGPGGPDLMTLQARKLLDDADVVIHDRLVAPEILELARREAILIDAGKRPDREKRDPGAPGEVNASQSWIDRAIVEHASAGRKVVRLKGGDPSVFGRAEEEIAAARRAGFRPVIAPGVTAASAAAAELGVSLTARGRNSAVVLATGRDRAGMAEQDWRALARPGAVAAIYMAKKAARFVQGRLFMHGADPATPVAIVENAGRPDARTLEGDLASLVALARRTRADAPALVMIGVERPGAAERAPASSGAADPRAVGEGG